MPGLIGPDEARRVADAALKRAPAVLLSSRTLSAGKHLIILEGDVASVEESMAAGRAAAGELLVDRVELAMADAQVWPMLAPAGVVTPASSRPSHASEWRPASCTAPATSERTSRPPTS